jgi:hypothetical protein
MGNMFDPPNWNGNSGSAVNGMLDALAVTATSINYAESLVAAGAKALDTDGDLRAGRHWFELAYRVAQSAGDPHAMAVAALGLGGLWTHQHRAVRDSAVFEVRLRQALSLIEPGSALGIRLRARLAAEADFRAGRQATILAVLDEARRTTDPVARVEALSLAHHCALGPEHGALRRELAAELIGASVLTGRRGDLLTSVLWHAIDHFLDGKPHAQRLLGELRDLLAEGEHLAVGFRLSAIEVMLAIRGGRLHEAEAMAERCATRGTAAGDVDASGWYWAHLIAIRWYQGDLGKLLPTLEHVVHSPTLSTVDFSYVATLALAAAQTGDRRAATGALARLAGDDLANLPRSSGWLAAMGAVVEAAYLLDDSDLAARAYDLLAPFAHLPMVAGLGVACFGSVHHALGVACLTGGQLDRAVHHLRAAVYDNLALGHWPAAALSRQRYAQALTRRGRPQDIAVARLEMAAAEQEAKAMGVALREGDAAGSPTPTGAPEPSRSAESPGSPAEPESAGLTAVCVRDGLQWRIELAGRDVLVEHAVGMLHLAVLLASPGVNVPAIELAAGVAALGSRGGRTGLSAQPVLDRSAINEYRQRVVFLRTQIEELEADNQFDRAGEVRTEHDWLMAELAAAAGLGGRSRRFPDNHERARLAVGRAIRRAIARINDADPAIGEHLQRGIHTGIQCSYRPGRTANSFSPRSAPLRQA